MKSLIRSALSLLIVASFTACLDTGSDSESSSPSYAAADQEVTENISFSNGTLIQGAPPAATNNPGDPYLTEPVTSSNAITPGSGGELQITLNNMTPNQAFDVNVKFGTANKYVRVPVSAATIGNNTGGTLNLPFSIPSSICDNIEDIEHQIKCYESVDIGNGVKVSKQTARTMLLACSSNSGFATGPNDYCADNYAIEACDILGTSGVLTQYVANSSCASAFPNSYILGDYGCTSSGSFTSCGACAVQVSSTASPSRSSSLEDQMFEELQRLATDPELQKKITFTPAP